MKNYNEFINYNEQLNEGLFGWINNMFKKATEQYRKIKGGKEIKQIHDEYMNIIEDEIKKQADVNLELSGEEQSTKSIEKEKVKPIQTSENVFTKYTDFINEEVDVKDPAPKVQPTVKAQPEGEPTKAQPEGEEKSTVKSQPEGEVKSVNNTMTAETLKKKSQLIQKIIDINVNKALKKMDQVLQKQGGAEKNPQLKNLIDLQKDEFQLSYLNAQIKFLEKSGDKNAINIVSAQRNKLAKELDSKFNTLGTTTDVVIETESGKFNVGSSYRYKTPDGIKTIKIIKKSDKPDQIIASYVSDKFGKTDEQSFKLSNIETDFKPEKDSTYKYFSKTNNDLIDVVVIGDPDNKGMVKVKSGENEFNINVGALGSKV